MLKKEYVLPELSFVRFTLREVLTSSPENFNSHVDSSLPDWDDPIIPDDEIEW